jgi:hypothetical protein
MIKLMWRAEPVVVEKTLDDLWIGVKSQSSLEIAGSPRNSLRTSVDLTRGGRALTGLGGLPAYRTPSNSEYLAMYIGSQTVGDKLHCQKGNSPEQQLRSLIDAQW